MERSKTLRMELPAARRRPEPAEASWVTLVRWVLAFLVAVLASVVSVPVDARGVQADTVVSGRVVGVSDGDTVMLLTDDLVQHKVRLRGIDAPEKAQAFGNRAEQALSALVFGRRVSVAYSKVDRYGRWVGRITVGSEQSAVDVSRAMISQGMAWHYVFYEREQPEGERVGDAEAEQVARLERRGFWGDREPLAPWDFRKLARGGKATRRHHSREPLAERSPLACISDHSLTCMVPHVKMPACTASSYLGAALATPFQRSPCLSAALGERIAVAITPSKCCS